MNYPLASNTSRNSVIHLDKSKEIPTPNQPFIIEGGTTSIKFSSDQLSIKNPNAAALIAVPVWWGEWAGI